MTLFQIITISFFSISLAWVVQRLYQLVRPRLTTGTTLLFASFVFLALTGYFGILANYVDGRLENKAQLLLGKISYWGVLFSLGLFIVSAGMAVFLLIIERVLPKRNL